MKIVYQRLLALAFLISVKCLYVVAQGTPQCNFPPINKNKDRGVYLWNDCFSDQWHVRVVAGKQQAAVVDGTFDAEVKDGLRVNKLYLLEAKLGDKATASGFQFNVGKKDIDGFDFKTSKGKVCLTINSPDDIPFYIGKTKLQYPKSISIPGYKPCGGPLMEYKFDSPRRIGSSINIDTGEKGWNGKVVGYAHYRDGFSKHGMGLDGRDDYMLIPASTDLQLKNYTLMAWVRYEDPYKPGNSQWIIQKAAAIGLNIRQDTRHVRTGGFFGGCGKNDLVQLDSTKTVPTETWTHIAATKDQEKLTLYINGENVGEKVLPKPNHYCVNKGPFNIGASYLGSKVAPGTYFDGTLDNVRVYDKALDKGEIFSEMFRQ